MKYEIATDNSKYQVEAKERPDQATAALICIEITTDHNAPRFCAGDLVFIDRNGNACKTVTKDSAPARRKYFADLAAVRFAL